MSALPFPLNLIANVTVLVSPQAPATPTFNEGLILGASTVIPSVGANSRVREYTSTAAILADGFTVNSPEYIAAQLYFSQTPTAQRVMIGRKDASSIATFQVHGGGAGTGYVVNDVVTAVQGGASGATFRVSAIGVGGAVTGLVMLTNGTGYVVANGLTTVGGTGTALQIDVLTIGETSLVALQNCRLASAKWYAAYDTTAVTADHLAIAAWIQTATPLSAYFYTTTDVAALNNLPNNVFAAMKAANYSRVVGVYSTSQGGNAPANQYFSAALMGYAMGANTGLINSAYTLKFKTLTGVVVEPLTQAQVNNIEGNNGNVYLNYGNSYTIFEQGVVANGQFFDEIINLDMLATNIQFALLNLLTQNPKIPQTDVGQTQLMHAVNQECEVARGVGFIGGGSGAVWEGVQVLNLLAGTPLPSGYLTQSPSYKTQTQSDRQARKAMPIYVALIEAGAAHFLTIALLVQR